MWIHGQAQGLPPLAASCAPSTQHRRDCIDGCHLLLLHQPGTWPCTLSEAEDTDQSTISVTVIIENGNSVWDWEVGQRKELFCLSLFTEICSWWNRRYILKMEVSGFSCSALDLFSFLLFVYKWLPPVQGAFDRMLLLLLYLFHMCPPSACLWGTLHTERLSLYEILAGECLLSPLLT